MSTRNVVLTQQQAEFIETMVQSDRYQNASEVLRDGLRLLQQREVEHLQRVQAYQLGPVVNVNPEAKRPDSPEITNPFYVLFKTPPPCCFPALVAYPHSFPSTTRFSSLGKSVITICRPCF
jgi:putative addiction module CopG family antidote